MKDGMNDTEIYDGGEENLKFKVGDKVKIKIQVENVDFNTIGLEGKIVDIDKDWIFPYEVRFDNDKLKDKGVELFRDDDLELVESKPPTPFKTQLREVENKIAFIRDMDGSGGREKNIGLIDLDKGLHRMNMRTNDVEDLVMYINSWKPKKVIFEIHDKRFKVYLLSYATMEKCGFIITESGDVHYG